MLGSHRRHHITRLTEAKEIELGRKLNETEKKQIWDEATALAYNEFVYETVVGQQSGRADQISQEQSGHIGRLLLAFKVTPHQYVRRIRDAAEGIRKGHGNAAQHWADIVYYTFLQNFLFTAAQQALWVAFDDEEEWDAEINSTVNGMINNF